MPRSFGFESEEIGYWSRQLSLHLGRLVREERRTPLGQLVKSLISSRTYDAVSFDAYERLVSVWSDWASLAAATPASVRQVIADVTYAEDKAVNLVTTLQMIGRECADYDLDFLKAWPEERALIWLERYPGVGPKVAAATLNASTLRMRAFIVDGHVHRVLWRIGFIAERTLPSVASERVTGSAYSLDADGLLELFAQMKLLGQRICRFDHPNCAICPLATCCRTASRLH